MQIQRLLLSNYRNYEHLDLPITNGLCIFVGENAQGKTNLLEAIYYAATGRSFRTVDDGELVAWGADKAGINCDVERMIGPANIEIRLSCRSAKRITVNGRFLRRLADIFGYLNVVMFTPDDLQLVKGGPGERRRFLDIELAQVNATYRHDLSAYYRVLKQRNHLLRSILEGHEGTESLPAWNEQLLELGCRVMVKRAEAVSRLSEMATLVHGTITQEKEQLSIGYQPFFAKDNDLAIEYSDIAIREQFLAAMHRLRHAELARGQTLVGPQRDDLRFYIAGRDVRAFASQGQQRTAVLACKLAELEFMRSQTGEYPVLLLDDVMSELDQQRRQYFLQVISGRVQTFITTTSLHSFSKEFLASAQVASIVHGEVR